jgi:hypothetical protein
MTWGNPLQKWASTRGKTPHGLHRRTDTKKVKDNDLYIFNRKNLFIKQLPQFALPPPAILYITACAFGRVARGAAHQFG